MIQTVLNKKHSDVVLFSTADWDNPFWTNKQHTARCFARSGYRVLYVDSLGLRRPCFDRRDAFRIVRRLCRSFRPLIRVEHNIWRMSPIQIPLHGVSALGRVNLALLLLYARLAIRLLRFDAPIVWTYTPTIHNLIARLPRCLTVYHSVDDLRASPGVDAELIESGERHLAELADMTFTTSQRIQERLSAIFRRCRYFPNVCDYDLFRSSRDPLSQPADIRHVPRPRAIFVGALSAYKVDFELIRNAVLRFPTLHWMLLGQVGEGQPGTSFSLGDLDNVHLVGPCRSEELPAYLAHADVAVLPAPVNAYTESMFPLKFFEYLSAGKQVVATNLPALREFADLCFLAKNRDEFVDLVGKVVFEGLSREQPRIDAVCRELTWEKRFARMEEVFLPLIRGGS